MNVDGQVRCQLEKKYSQLRFQRILLETQLMSMDNLDRLSPNTHNEWQQIVDGFRLMEQEAANRLLAFVQRRNGRLPTSLQKWIDDTFLC
jgi:hypothetical protein